MSLESFLRIIALLLPFLTKLTHRMKRKTNQFSVRLDPQLQADVEECARITGLDPALFMREAFKAFVGEVRATGKITLPIAIVPRGEKSPRATVHPTSSTAVFSVNEQPTPARATAPPATPGMTHTRAVLRKMAKENPKP